MSRSVLVGSLAVLPLVILLSACERGESPANPPAPASAAANALPAGMFLAAAPADAKEVRDVRSAVPAAGTVVVRGRIGGRLEPFVANRAMFLLVDTRVPTCADNPADSCKTPWDYCCEPPDNLQVNSLTVQIVDAQGRPLKSDVQGQHGLKPLSEVVIRGRLQAAADGAPPVLNATGIYVRP